MTPARKERPLHETRLLIIERAGRYRDATIDDLPQALEPGDLVVVNDAATLPASLRGDGYELRLLGERDGVWTAFLLGAGDWRTPTEQRPSSTETALRFGDLAATVIERLSDRLVRVRFDREGAALHHAIYTLGQPVQYSHLSQELALWSVQTVYAARPWAVEMPSAGRPLTWRTLLALKRRGVELRSLTHAAGLSSSGEAALDAKLPLEERYEIPEATMRAVKDARRVIAVGTSVTRALETAAQTGAREGRTTLIIGASTKLQVVDGLLSGLHDPTASHFSLLSAFVPESLLRDAYAHAEREGYLGHELGDVSLIL